MGNLGRRAVEALLWIVGAVPGGIGALILWNLARGDSHDSGSAVFVLGAVMCSVPGVLLLGCGLEDAPAHVRARQLKHASVLSPLPPVRRLARCVRRPVVQAAHRRVRRLPT